MVLTTFPGYANDSGDGQSGTSLDADFFDDIKDGIDAQVHSANNSTLRPWHITDEVVNARGNKASLDARISDVIDDDGALITGSSVVSRAQAQGSFGAVNLLGNDTFLLWSAGDSAAPDFWTLSGAGAAVARTGALQFGAESAAPAESTKRKVGNFAAKVTYGSATAILTQSILDTAAYPSLNVFNNRVFGFGCWVFASVASQVRLAFNDGSQTSYSGYHTGGGGWEWLSGTHTVSGGATLLNVQGLVESSGSVYFSGMTAHMSSFAPTLWVPTPKIYREVLWFLVGNASAATKQFEYTFARPALIKDIALAAITAPASQALIVDANQGTGGTSMFSTRPQIAAAALSGSARPDAAYARRCFAKDQVLSVDVDQVGTGTVGAGLGVHIRFLQYARPLEDFLAHDDI